MQRVVATVAVRERAATLALLFYTGTPTSLTHGTAVPDIAVEIDEVTQRVPSFTAAAQAHGSKQVDDTRVTHAHTRAVPVLALLGWCHLSLSLAVVFTHSPALGRRE